MRSPGSPWPLPEKQSIFSRMTASSQASATTRQSLPGSILLRSVTSWPYRPERFAPRSLDSAWFVPGKRCLPVLAPRCPMTPVFMRRPKGRLRRAGSAICGQNISGRSRPSRPFAAWSCPICWRSTTAFCSTAPGSAGRAGGSCSRHPPGWEKAPRPSSGAMRWARS